MGKSHIIKNKEIDHVHNEFRTSPNIQHPFWNQVIGFDQDSRYVYIFTDYIKDEFYIYLRTLGRVKTEEA